RSVWKPGSEVETRADKDRRRRYRLPNSTHPNCAGRRSPCFRCRTSCLKLMADERPRARMGCRESFREKAFIRDRHRRSRNPQRGGQFSRGRQALSRSKAPVKNCLPDLTVDLATEVSSTDKTDMKSHGPGLSFLRIGLPTLHKGERSIIPLRRYGDRNRRFRDRPSTEPGTRHAMPWSRRSMRCRFALILVRNPEQRSIIRQGPHSEE